MKLSFDFDHTLSRVDVQIYAKNMVDAGHEVWIVTSRPDIYTGELQHIQPDNSDLYMVADFVGIKPQHIHFTCYELKSGFIDGSDFAFHLDDDEVELRFIAESGDSCVPIDVGTGNWREQCYETIEEYENTKN
jgi:hypothetical protein